VRIQHFTDGSSLIYLIPCRQLRIRMIACELPNLATPS
jgi:hypothetical protein